MENLEAKEYAEQQAEIALDAYDDAMPKIIALLEAIVAKDDDRISDREWREGIMYIDEAIKEMFHKRRKALMEIAGHRDDYELPDKYIWKPLAGVSKQIFDCLMPSDPMKQMENLIGLQNKYAATALGIPFDAEERN